jgi:hypothetical protein
MPSAFHSSQDSPPNRGTTIDANEATLDKQTGAEWQKQARIDTTKHVKLVRLSHMRYQHKDLDSITTFLKGTYYHFIF